MGGAILDMFHVNTIFIYSLNRAFPSNENIIIGQSNTSRKSLVLCIFGIYLFLNANHVVSCIKLSKSNCILLNIYTE